jgi:hypothetical protein
MRRSLKSVVAVVLAVGLLLMPGMCMAGALQQGGPAPGASAADHSGMLHLGGAGVLALGACGLMMGVAGIAHRGIPGPQDANQVLQAAVTKTASFDSAGLDLGAGFSPGGLGTPMAAVITITALDAVTGDETYTFTLQESDDNNTFVACGAAKAVTAVGVVAVKGLVTKRYVRLSLVEAGTTPSLSYSAALSAQG